MSYVGERLMGNKEVHFDWGALGASVAGSMIGGRLTRSNSRGESLLSGLNLGRATPYAAEVIGTNLSAALEDKWFGGSRPDELQVSLSAIANTMADRLVDRFSASRAGQAMQRGLTGFGEQIRGDGLDASGFNRSGLNVRLLNERIGEGLNQAVEQMFAGYDDEDAYLKNWEQGLDFDNLPLLAESRLPVGKSSLQALSDRELGEVDGGSLTPLETERWLASRNQAVVNGNDLRQPNTHLSNSQIDENVEGMWDNLGLLVGGVSAITSAIKSFPSLVKKVKGLFQPKKLSVKQQIDLDFENLAPELQNRLLRSTGGKLPSQAVEDAINLRATDPKARFQQLGQDVGGQGKFLDAEALAGFNVEERLGYFARYHPRKNSTDPKGDFIILSGPNMGRTVDEIGGGIPVDWIKRAHLSENPIQRTSAYDKLAAQLGSHIDKADFTLLNLGNLRQHAPAVYERLQREVIAVHPRRQTVIDISHETLGRP